MKFRALVFVVLLSLCGLSSVHAAASLTNKGNDVSVANGFDTPSFNWTAGTHGIVAVATAVEPPSIDASSHTVTGGGVTWTVLLDITYKFRRVMTVLVSDGTPSTGVLTITSTTANVYQESQWSVDQINDPHATPYGTAFGDDEDGVALLNTPDLGTIGANDIAYFALGFEGATDSLAVASGSSQHILRQSGGNVRSLLIGTSTTDDTPGATWGSGSNGAGIIGLIIAGASGGGSPLLLIRRRH